MKFWEDANFKSKSIHVPNEGMNARGRGGGGEGPNRTAPNENIKFRGGKTTRLTENNEMQITSRYEKRGWQRNDLILYAKWRNQN